jgi:hypothetical protein
MNKNDGRAAIVAGSMSDRFMARQAPPVPLRQRPFAGIPIPH